MSPLLDMSANEPSTKTSTPSNSKPNLSSSQTPIARKISSDSVSMAAISIIEKEKNSTLNEKKSFSSTTHNGAERKMGQKNGEVPSSSHDISQRPSSCGDSIQEPPVQDGANATTAQPESSGVESTSKIRPFTRTEHREFVSAILDIGVKNCSPVVIMELLRNDDKHVLTREIMKSHLQKYRKIQDRGKGAFLQDYDLFLRKLENSKGHLIAANKKKEEEEGAAINGSDLGEAAIKKALGRRRPMNLLGGHVAALMSFSVANDCQENVLESLNSTKVEVPVLTEAEKNTKLGKSLTSIAGLLIFLKEQLKKARSNSAVDSARIQQLVTIMATQLMRQQQQAAMSSMHASAGATSKNKNNSSTQSFNTRAFPTRRMSCPQPYSNPMNQPSFAGQKRRHSTMSHSFSQNLYHPSASSSTAEMASIRAFHHQQVYGNSSMLWGHQPYYQSHGNQYPTTYMHHEPMQPPTVNSVVYQPQEQWQPPNNSHQHPSTMQQPQVSAPGPHAQWSYQQHQQQHQQQWAPSSSSTSRSSQHNHHQQQWEPSPCPTTNDGPSILPNHNQPLPAKVQQRHSYNKHVDRVSTPSKTQPQQHVSREQHNMMNARSPSVYDYFSDLEEEDDHGRHDSFPHKRRKRSDSFSSMPYDALHDAYQRPTPPKQQRQQHDSWPSTYYRHYQQHHDPSSWEGKMAMAAVDLQTPGPFPPSTELRW